MHLYSSKVAFVKLRLTNPSLQYSLLTARLSMMNLCPLTTMLALLAATIIAQPCLCFFLFDHQVLLVDLYFAQGSCPNLQGKF